MKKTNLLLLLFAVFMISFTSCTKEETSSIDTTEIPTEVDTDQYNPLLDNIENRDDLEEGLNLGCFSINTPFSLDVDGTIVEINTFEDLENAFDFDANDVAINVDFVYPLAVTYEDGTTAELADGEALGEAFALCIPDEGWEEPDSTGFDGSFPAFLITELNSCYTLVYPVTLQDFDGITYTANSEDELIELLASEDFLEFVLPLSLEGEEGIVTATNVEELFDVLVNCQDQPWDDEGDDEDYDCPLDIGGIACYDIAFPVTFTTVSGGEIVVNDYEELSAAILGGNVENFVFPITLTHVETTEITTVNNDEELSVALDACWGGEGNGDGGSTVGGDVIIFFLFSDDFENGCYSINYPLDVITIEDTQVTYSSSADVLAALETGVNLPNSLVYPITVINSNGETVTLEGDEDTGTLLIGCE